MNRALGRSARHQRPRSPVVDVAEAVVVGSLTLAGGLAALVASLIREGKTAQIASAIQAGKREGMIALERSLADRVRAQEVTLDEARAAANDPESLAAYLTQT